MRLGVRFLVMVPPGGDARVPDDVRAIVDEIRARMPAVELEVIETDQPAAALVAIAAEERDAVILLPRHRRRRARGTGLVPGRGGRHEPSGRGFLAPRPGD